MVRALRALVLAAFATVGGTVPTARAQLSTPQAITWGVTGSARSSYAIAGIEDSGHKLSLTRVSVPFEMTNAFGATAAVVDAGPYRGRRVRLRALVRTDTANAGGSTWLRIDGDAGMLALENNLTRALRGTTDWTEQVTELDVPAAAKMIIFGLLLPGGGTVHAKELTIEAVALPTSP